MENNKKDKTKNKGGIGRILRVMIPKCFKAAPKHWIFMICTDCTFSVISVMLVAALQYFLDNVSGAIKGLRVLKSLLYRF